MTQAVLLAFRNLFRSPKRSLSLLTLMCAAFLALTLIRGGYADMFSGIKESYARSRGDIAFSVSKGRKGMNLADYSALKAKLLADGRFAAVRAAAAVEGLIGTENGSAPASGEAVEDAFSDWRADDASAKAELGDALAASLGLKTGDQFSGFVNDSGFSFLLEGVVRTEAKTRDRFFLRMPLEALGERDPEARISRISVWFADIARQRRSGIIEELGTFPEFSEYGCSAYELGNTEVNSIVDVYEDNFIVVLLVVSVTMLLALTNVMLLSSWERGQEWGTMLALGSPFASLRAVIVLEAVFIAAAAGAAGGLLTLGISALANAAGGIVLPAPPTASAPLRIGLKPEIGAFAFALCVSAACAFAAALIAAHNVKRNTIIELLFERN